VKVLDFGIARLAEASWQNSADRTRTNATMGTPAFMAPEQALGRSAEVDAKTDLWAVGATLFKLLTARNVHEASTINEQLVNAATKPAPPLRTILANAAPELAVLVDKALAFAKGDRWPDARAMQRALRPLLPARSGLPYVRPSSVLMAQNETMIPPPPPATVEESTTVGTPARKRAVMVIAAVAVVVLLGAAWLLTRQRGETVVVVPASAPAKPEVVVPPPVEKVVKEEPAVEEEKPAVKAPAVKVSKPDKKRARTAKPAEGADDIWDKRH
jgi:serine/threonine-protein kinase